MLPMEVRDRFIELLVETGNVSHATRRLGINRMTAYGWRVDPAYAQKWDMALAIAREGLRDKVLETACAMGLAEHGLRWLPNKSSVQKKCFPTLYLSSVEFFTR